ncbi:MAG TPA: glycosyltransferase family 1 protein [Dehalococcoidia bacterium]|jgi:glycosyltransferase involved in cell wall biosynthesis|nr:glycosyltransferase family 1 protein [Dehalococcoidia bacterium]
MKEKVPGKIGIQQRVLPRYRKPFFDLLAERCSGDLGIFAGEPRPEENIVIAEELDVANYRHASNVHISRGRTYFCWQRGMRRWLNEYDPDALIVAADPRILTNYLAIRHMRARRRPVIGWGLGTLNPPRNGDKLSMVSRLRSRLYRTFDAVIAYSSKAAEDYRRAGVPDERIFVAHNSVSTESADAARKRFPAGGLEVQEWRTSQGLSRPTVICVGRLIPGKRLDLLIEACRENGDDCDLVIVGDGPERSALEQLAAERFPRTRFLGHLEGDSLSIAFGASDVFVLPGTGGLAIYEAMAHGKPVIVGQGDGTESDLVYNGRNGCHVSPGDVGALTSAIQAYLRQPELVIKAGQESRRIVEEEVSIDRMSSAFVHALQFAETVTGVE